MAKAFKETVASSPSCSSRGCVHPQLESEQNDHRRDGNKNPQPGAAEGAKGYQGSGASEIGI